MRFLTEQKIAFVTQKHQPISYFIGALDLSSNKTLEKPLGSISATFEISFYGVQRIFQPPL